MACINKFVFKALSLSFRQSCHLRKLTTVPPPITVASLLHPRLNGSDQYHIKSDTEITVYGFIHSIRNQKTKSFAAIGDGSCINTLQALLKPAQAKGLFYGTAVAAQGFWRPSLNPTKQSHELHVSKLDVIATTDSTYPLQKKYQTTDFLRTMPHLRVRVPFNSTLLRLRSNIITTVTNILSDMGFTQTHTPIITSSDCEGAGEVFQVDQVPKQGITSPDHYFFRSPKYLTVSSQLHLEALAQAVGKVWTLSPTFRAEKSDTSRHLSEFYMLEAEMNFVESMHVLMNQIRRIILPVVQNLFNSQTGIDLLSRGPLAKDLERRWDGLRQEWKSITYTEAIRILQSSSHGFQNQPKWGLSLQAEHEKYLTAVVGENANLTSPIFVTHYPKAIKPFYVLPSEPNDTGLEIVECFDLLVPGMGEIAGGSMREHRLEPLLNSMYANGLISSVSPTDQDLRDLKWYVDLRKWGSVPHGGFGLGFDRLLSYLSGVPNIRELVAFPRWVGRCDC